LLLFFLNPESNVHRQKVLEAVKDKFPTVSTSSTRREIYAPLKEAYQGLPSGVDIAHLVFNTMLYADTCEYVLIGNEYSSNFPNDIYEGSVVNHHYVKSIRFAEKLNAYLQEYVTKDFAYYSPFFVSMNIGLPTYFSRMRNTWACGRAAINLRPRLIFAATATNAHSLI
jgi:hypothetical protein